MAWHQEAAQGSTAQEIACLARKPVLSIGPAVFGQHDFKAILYVTDFTPCSVHTLAYALSLAEKYRARLVVLHVNDGEGPEPHADARTKASEFFRKYLADESKSLPGKPNVIVDFAPRTELILEYAEREGADLIAMGLHQLGGIKARIASHLPGSTPYEVMSSAHCPVLTVPLTKQSHQGKRVGQ